jgi:hypothetical protein
LVIVQPQPPLTELFAQNTILFAKAVNDLQLALIHPTGNGDQDNRNGSRTLRISSVHYSHCRS